MLLFFMMTVILVRLFMTTEVAATDPATTASVVGLEVLQDLGLEREAGLGGRPGPGGDPPPGRLSGRPCPGAQGSRR